MTFARQEALGRLAKQVDEIFRSHPEPGQASSQIEACIEQAFHDVPLGQRLASLEEFIDFYGSRRELAPVPPLAHQPLGLLVSLLLGKRLEDVGCTPDELLQRLGSAMNTVFDSLNELQRAINCSLLGQSAQTETIRLVIASSVEGSSEATPLQDYLDQIKEAFFIMYSAFKESSVRKMGELLAELDPERLAGELQGSIKVGPFRKADMYDLFTEKYRNLATALEQGRIAASLLRDFERSCQQLYAKKGKAHA